MVAKQEFFLTSKSCGKRRTNTIYSLCSKYQIFATNSLLYIYSNDQLVNKFDISEPLNMIASHPEKKNLIYLISNQNVMIYDFTCGVELARIDHLNCILFEGGYSVTLEEYYKEGDGKIHKKYKLFKLIDKEFKLIYKLDFGVNLMKITKDGTRAIFSNSRKTVFIFDLKTYELVTFNVSKPISTLAINPWNDTIAVADISGLITISYVLKSRKLPRKLHWHSGPVSSINFTEDGYMMTGGIEATLVIWQLETEKKRFIPRLSGSIKEIVASPDGQEYMLTLLDNSIVFFNSADLDERKFISGLQMCHLSEQHYKGSIGLVQDPKTGFILVNGSPGKLQLIDTFGETKEIVTIFLI